MHYFFEPRSVVLIGVPRKTGPGAYNGLEMLLRYGYQGKIYVVHPKASEILGIRTCARVADLPEIPDLAVISLGRDRVLPVFSECVHKGIRRVIIISQGFADADQQGKELQQQLVDLGREHGTRIIGPNTMGILNAFYGFSSAFVDIPRGSTPAPLTVVAQTGALQVGFDSFAGRLGKAADLGNACDVDFADVLTYLQEDPQTGIIVLHMEGMKRGHEFLQAAARASRKKPVIVLKTGRTGAGARAALSHTGSLVGEDELFDLAFHRAGVIRARDMLELGAALQAFLHFRPMQGPRLGVVTATGACGIIAADACEAYGLELAPVPEGMQELENPHLSWHRLHNPADIWPLGMVSGSFTGVFKDAVRRLLGDQQTDAILGIAPVMSSPLHADLDMVGAIREILADNGQHKPIALWFYGDGVESQRRALADYRDVACFDSIEEAVMGLAATWRYQRYRGQERPQAVFPESTGLQASRPMPLTSQDLLLGDNAFALLEHFGLPLAPGQLALDEDQAVSIARRVGFPVVMKIISPQWLHKSDQGGVFLGIGSEAEVRQGYDKLQELFQEHTVHGTLEGILVQKQVQGREILLGVKKDEHFGPILVVGAGGIYTELFRDVARSLLPIDHAEAEAMLKSLRIYPVLEGARGQRAVNLGALKEAMVAVSRLALAYPQIRELDLNPVFASPEGCWCADCRMVLEH